MPADLRITRPTQLLRDQVTDTLRLALRDGVFNPGDRLIERRLLELTGVSRTSLREGLRQLQSEGIVEAAPNRGLRVALFNESELAELYQVREHLEGAAVELFVDHATDEDVRLLRERFVDAGRSRPEPAEPLSGYYEHLFMGGGNALLRRMYESIAVRIALMQNLSYRSPGRAEESRREIEQILNGIESRDVDAAVSAARQHVRAAGQAALLALRARAVGADDGSTEG